jgi:zinc protease
MKPWQIGIEPLRLPSGTTLVVVADPTAPATAIVASVRIGGVEQRRQPGVATLLARMLGGDSQGRTPELLLRDVEGFGALGTNYEGSQLTAWSVCPPTEAALAQSAQTLLLNALAQPRFTPEALEQARLEQLRAVALWQEDLVPRLLHALEARALGTELEVQGDESTVRRVSLTDVQAFYGHYCTPERTTVAVVGKFDPEVARKWVEVSLSVGDWNQRPAGVRELLPKTEPIPSGLRDRLVPSFTGVTALAVGFLFPGLGQPEGRADWAALLVLDAVLGLGKACRLFSLRDSQSLAYEVRSVLRPGRGQTLWAAYLLGDQDPTRMKDALLQTLAELPRKPITESELERAKALLLAQRNQQRQLVLARARALATAESSGLGAAFELEFSRRIEAIKRADVERVARLLFGGNPAIVRTRG